MSDTAGRGGAAVAHDRVVRFHYDLRDASGTLVESSRQGSPVAVLWGRGGIIRGIERALEGRAPGDRFQVTVPPGEGYGERRDGWTQRVSKKHLAGAPKRLRPGMQVAVRTDEGLRPVRVLKVGSSVVDVDLNHPLAGLELTATCTAQAATTTDGRRREGGPVHVLGADFVVADFHLDCGSLQEDRLSAARAGTGPSGALQPA